MPTARRHERAETIARGIASVGVDHGVDHRGRADPLACSGSRGGTVLTSAGLIGVALRSARRTCCATSINGSFIIIEDQIGVGDVVDVGVATGTVEDVSLRTTRAARRRRRRLVRAERRHRAGSGTSRSSGRAPCSTSRCRTSADIDAAERVIAETAVALAQDNGWTQTHHCADRRCGASSRSRSTR